MARTHELASASPPYERVPSISQYSENNLFIIYLLHLSSSFTRIVFIRNQNITSAYQPKSCLYALDSVQYAGNIARVLQCKVNMNLFRYIIIKFLTKQKRNLELHSPWSPI